jgi:hypothetical protein
MGLLSSLFGGSSSQSNQSQRSNSFGFGLNRGSSSSASGATSSGRSGGVSGSSDSVFSGDLLRQLYGDALGAVDSINPAMATDRVNQLFTGGTDILSRLADGGAGEDYLNRRLSGDGGEVLNASIDSLGADLGRFFNEELNPAIQGSAVAAGQLGGGRQGVAQAGAASGVLREFATGAAGLRAADVAQRDSAALGLLESQNQRGTTALGALPQLASLGSGASALDPYRALGEIFGGPTVTTESFGSEVSEQEAQEFATSLAEELGITYDEAHSLLTASSKGKSSGGIIPGLGSLVPKG